MNAVANSTRRFQRLAGLVTLCMIIGWTDQAWGYEQATHAALTREAYVRAKINPGISDLALRLGLEASQGMSLGDWYVDITPTDPVMRKASPDDNPNFGMDKISDANFWVRSVKPELPTLPAWLMLGAIREDDVPLDPDALENNPQDEPGGPFIRVLRHFYDPFNDRALATIGTRASDWALDATAENHKNHFTVSDAREALWRAVTLKRIEAGALIDLVDPADLPTYADLYLRDLRLAYWATTFRALGDVLHLLQDMAQPQHTRSDPHSGMGCRSSTCLGGHASYYEKYVDARATGANEFRLRERFFAGIVSADPSEIVAATDLNYGGYPAVALSSYSDYFATATGVGSLGGRGLANYSNQGFFTAGTNLDSLGGGYLSPPVDANAFQIEIVPVGSVANVSGKTVTAAGWLALLKGTVTDSSSAGLSASGVALSSFGAFDQFMHGVGRRQFSLNHYNYDDQARLLIPRAVAYSAGFLDYFFRGVLDINLPSAGVYAVVDQTRQGCTITCGFQTVRLKLKNSTPNETLSNGFFVAVAKFFRNNRYAQDLSGEPGGPNFTGFDARSFWEEIVVSDKLPISSLAGGRLGPNGEAELRFNFASPIPINATDIYLQVVFRGQLGNEADAVVVTTKNISEPNYIAVVNDLDYQYDASTDTFKPTDPKTMSQTVTNLGVKLNGASTPIATLAQLSVRGYAQLAFLTDLGADGTEKLAIDFSSGGLNGPLSFTNFPIATFTSSGPGNYERSKSISRYRGMWSDYRFDLFSVSAPYALYDCVAGDTRRICTSAGLTTIPASNAVAWSINFP